MDATLILIDSDTGLARAQELVAVDRQRLVELDVRLEADPGELEVALDEAQELDEEGAEAVRPHRQVVRPLGRVPLKRFEPLCPPAVDSTADRTNPTSGRHTRHAAACPRQLLNSPPSP